MTTTTTTTAFGELQISDIDPDPDNRNAVVNADFVQSIKTVGVIEPIVVVDHPTSEGRYMLVAGERRWRGATKAGLTTIPAVVRRDLDDRARIELAVVENLQREDLPVGQESIQLLRLITVGHNCKTLANTIGRSQKWVKERLLISELPKQVRDLLDNGHMSIATAVAAHALIDQPDLLDQILVTEHARDIDNLVRSEVNKISFHKHAKKLLREATENRLHIHDDKSHITPLLELGLSEQDHLSETCHRVDLTGNPSWGNPRLTHGCVDPTSHSRKGTSKIKVQPARTGRPSSEADTERLRLRREAKGLRLEAMQGALVARLPKGSIDQLIYSSSIHRASHELCKSACRILDLTVERDQNPSDVLDLYASSGTKQMQRAALAVAMAVTDQGLDNTWSPISKTRAKAWMTWLKKASGYTPTVYDRQQIAATN